jgi:DNA invertase Pin-like site-specific DNA recombinase
MIQARVLGYCCASTDPGIEPPEIQKGVITSHVQQLRRTVDGVYVDRAADEDRPLRERQAGRHLAADLRRGDHLVVARFDRICRSYLEFARLLDDWTRLGVVLHLADPGCVLDPSNPSCQAMVKLFTQFANCERRLRGLRTRKGIAALRASGQRYSRIAPWGFQWKRRNKKQVMVPAPREQRIAMRAAELRAQGYSFDQIRQYLNYTWRVRNRKGNQFGGEDVRRIVFTGAELLRAAQGCEK